MKLSNTNLHTIIGYTVILIVVLYLLISPKIGDYSLHIKAVMAQEYEGKVIKKYLNKDIRNEPTVILTNGEEIVFYDYEYYKISIGDSLAKKLNSTILYIYRKDKIIKADFKEDIRYFKDKT